MDQITLFTRTPPSPIVHEPLQVNVPERYRAELYKAELEDTCLVLEAYAERHPEVAPALLDVKLIEALALLLDDYIGPSVVADVNAYARNNFPGQNISRETYRRYCAACLERAADPYRLSAESQLPALSSTIGAWDGVQAFYRRYPMARFMVNMAMDNYQRNIQRCCDRVLEDWPDLQTYFFGGTVVNVLRRIGSTGSDFHKGGGQVLILTFKDAAQQDHMLVYKPTDVERDFRIVGDTDSLTAAINGNTLRVVTHKGVTAPVLLNAAGSLGELLKRQAVGHGDYDVPVYRILPIWPGSGLAAVNGSYPIRQSYGYLQYLSSDPADNRFAQPADRQPYYQSFGAQLALCWVFQITDLHQENLIVHRHMPYLIDLEMAYTGIMALPSDTNLRSAYRTFSVGNAQRDITGFGTNALSFSGGHLPDQPTKNALYDNNGGLTTPSTTDRANVWVAFSNVMTLIKHNQAAYDAWLVAAQHTVTRIIPYGTDFFLGQLHGLNSPEDTAIYATFPQEITLRMLHNGNIDIQNWGDNFQNHAVAAGIVVNINTLNQSYNAIAPKFAIWFDQQTATDFKSGDVPAYYQKMSTAQAMGSRGAPLQVNYGLAVQNTAAINQQPAANALVTLWGTVAPLLPNSYFPAPVVQGQRAYLQALQQNNAGYTTARVQNAVNDIAGW
jgi:hypothetical protein